MSTGKVQKMKTIRWFIINILLITMVLSGAVSVFGVAHKAEEPPALDATSAIMMDADTGEILYEKNAYEKRDPASITKILNCLVVLDTLDMDQEVTIGYNPESRGTTMDLEKGETLKVRDLVYAMMVWSANDAAEALAGIAGGDIETFCGMMNDRAAACGAKDTRYNNPNGLNMNKVNNITTAYDIARIAAIAMNNPEFARIVETEYLSIPATNKHKQRQGKSTNRCISDKKKTVEINGEEVPLKYKGCKGIKTGYSSTAGDCYCGYATRGKTSLIVVVLNASHEIPKYIDTINLWNYGFENFKTYHAARVSDVIGQQPVKRGSLRSVDIGVSRNLAMTVPKNYKASEKVTVEIRLDEEKVMAPVSRGDVLGEAVAIDENGKELANQEVISLEDAKEGAILSHIGIADEDIPLLLIALAVPAAVFILLKRRERKKQNRQRRKARIKRAVRRQERQREREPFAYYGRETARAVRDKETEEEKNNRQGRV